MRIKSKYYGFILLAIILLNIIFSTYFITIFFIGVVFILFNDCLKREYYYLFILSIITFLFIESLHGIKGFLFLIIASLLYGFIIPRLKNIFAYSYIKEIVYIFIFYIMFFLSYIIIYGNFDNVIPIFLLNLVIDTIIVGFLL
ncbi:MAG: hypothetical protein U9Q30_03620 [Campylobacterota bacterium]|nr:hypothetical protein [Campylobacterota bacterium]